MFRLEKDGAVVNRYGFNSDGLDVVHGRLKVRACAMESRARSRGMVEGHPGKMEGHEKTPPPTPWKPKSFVGGHALGINLGKNKLSAFDSNQDFVWSIREVGHLADYLVVNISSPNTPGLRQLQKKEILDRLVAEVRATPVNTTILSHSLTNTTDDDRNR